MDIHKRSSFIHHNQSALTESIKEIVFGAEDGMVSTLGALTGIAAGTENGSIVLLAGVVIVCVESISMGVGSYLSSKSSKQLEERMLDEERTELREMPREEEIELADMYRKDGWPADLSGQMAAAASKSGKLFLKEMAYRELRVIPDALGNPFRDGLIMFISYVAGGSIPVLPYLFFHVSLAFPISIGITLSGLFMLGVFTTRFTKQRWLKAGLEMFLLASTAAGIGFIVGRIADSFISLPNL
ncbi:MAG: VIT1/CCC1 transporter family protein [Candidatus Komeilibacteria bacterium]|nr:VIT1/CCC1 transporter family protein [Candidatus Komeilibacteria bacterium]